MAPSQLGLTEAPPQHMTADQFDTISEAFNDLLTVLRDADPRDKAELYARIGLRLTYRPGPDTVIAEVVVFGGERGAPVPGPGVVETDAEDSTVS